jgi:hypothetical protein
MIKRFDFFSVSAKISLSIELGILYYMDAYLPRYFEVHTKQSSNTGWYVT